MTKLNNAINNALTQSDEIVLLRAQNIELRNEINELRSRFSELEVLADTDSLTPLPNRRCFMRELDRVNRHVARYQTGAAMLYVDVDGLKTINDLHGHIAGDATLVHVAKLLRTTLRSTDLVARIGGDEFGLLIDPIKSDALIHKVATLARLIRISPLEFEGKFIEVSVSIGYTMIHPADTVEQVLDRADVAMYNYKRAQRSDK